MYNVSYPLPPPGGGDIKSILVLLINWGKNKKVRKGVGKNIILDETLYTPLLSLELMSVYFVRYFYSHCASNRFSKNENICYKLP